MVHFQRESSGKGQYRNLEPDLCIKPHGEEVCLLVFGIDRHHEEDKCVPLGLVLIGTFGCMVKNMYEYFCKRMSAKRK